LFGAIVSTQEAPEGLLKSELPLFRRFHVENVVFLDPLMWWAANESRFPNVGFWHDIFWASQVHILRLSESS
jgi:hypothetical protein